MIFLRISIPTMRHNGSFTSLIRHFPSHPFTRVCEGAEVGVVVVGVVGAGGGGDEGAGCFELDVGGGEGVLDCLVLTWWVRVVR